MINGGIPRSLPVQTIAFNSSSDEVPCRAYIWAFSKKRVPACGVQTVEVSKFIQDGRQSFVPPCSYAFFAVCYLYVRIGLDNFARSNRHFKPRRSSKRCWKQGAFTEKHLLQTGLVFVSFDHVRQQPQEHNAPNPAHPWEPYCQAQFVENLDMRLQIHWPSFVISNLCLIWMVFSFCVFVVIFFANSFFLGDWNIRVLVLFLPTLWWYNDQPNSNSKRMLL